MITVAITCYNEERFIEDAVRSVLAFTSPEGEELEFFVVDGMSTDNTRSIVQGIQKEFPELQLIDNPDRYQGHGINLAIDKAKGEYLVRLDAHAVYPADYLDVPEEVLEYSTYITEAVTQFEAIAWADTNYLSSPPTLTTAANMDPAVVFPASTFLKASIMEPGGVTEQQLRSRGIYIDYMS